MVLRCLKQRSRAKDPAPQASRTVPPTGTDLSKCTRNTDVAFTRELASPRPPHLQLPILYTDKRKQCITLQKYSSTLKLTP